MVYATVLSAAVFFESIGVDEWLNNSPEEQEAALTVATQALDALYGPCYRGEMLEPLTQEYLFPRTAFVDANGRPVPEGTIPASLHNATCYAALAHLEGEDIYSVDQSANNVTGESFSVGSLSESFQYGEGARAQAEIPVYQRTITPLLECNGSGSSGGWRQGTASNG